MERKKFITRGIIGLGAMVTVPSLLSNCNPDEKLNTENNGDCALSPSETKGPFPIKTPSEMVKENIVSDRNGIALLIKITVQDRKNNCLPISGALVDVWHCDSQGAYSEYGGNQLQEVNYTNVHFLRGRQITNSQGEVSFISIYPGWYPGRAPHIHIEVKDSIEKSLLVSQIAFPESVSQAVYQSEFYNGIYDTPNSEDNIFADGVDGNLCTVIGNNEDGYILNFTMVVDV